MKIQFRTLFSLKSNHFQYYAHENKSFIKETIDLCDVHIRYFVYYIYIIPTTMVVHEPHYSISNINILMMIAYICIGLSVQIFATIRPSSQIKATTKKKNGFAFEWT